MDWWIDRSWRSGRDKTALVNADDMFAASVVLVLYCEIENRVVNTMLSWQTWSLGRIFRAQTEQPEWRP